MSKRLKKYSKAFSLIEMLVAVSISTLVIGLTTGTWLRAMNAYKIAKAQTKMQDESRYLIEYISKDLRMAAIIDSSAQQGANDMVYYTTSGDYFVFDHAECGSLKQCNSSEQCDTLNSENVCVYKLKSGDSEQDVFGITCDGPNDRHCFVTIQFGVKDTNTGSQLEVRTGVAQRSLLSNS